MKNRHINGTKDTPQRGAELSDLQRAIESHRGHTVFLSSEEFFSAPKDGIAWLRDGLGDHPVEVLCFLRRPDAFLLSCYSQKARHPGNGFHQPLDVYLADPTKIAREIDYESCVGAWADVFGDTAINLQTYENGPPLARTLAALGLPADRLPDKRKINTSAPSQVIDCMRHAKEIGLSKARQKAILVHASRYFADNPPISLNHAQRQKIVDRFEPANERLFQRFAKENPFVANAVPANSGANQTVPVTAADLIRFIDDLI